MAESLPSSVDGLVSAAAARRPDGVALRAHYGDVTFAELDSSVSAAATALVRLLGTEPDVIALASPLHPDFAVAFHGAIRAGKTVAPLNPLLTEHELEHLLVTSKARLVFVTDVLFERVRRIAHRLPLLAEAILIGPGPAAQAGAVRTLDDLVAAYDISRTEPVPPARTACVLFTSGTTGPPKGCRLSQANLVVNAAQTAVAHLVDETSVVLNHLPKYHLMHLNSAVHAAATQVLCQEWDVVKAVELANTAGATHYYSIPMRLTKLAGHPRLPELRLTTVRAIASGGSALAPAAASTLADHFGIPVFQGYGLAETSPLTHSATPLDPAVGTVGRPVADTECRIVDPGTGEPVAAGAEGEIQVRGPQVMLGYSEHDSGVDDEGWFATGDIGRLDDDGRLVVVDRIKDVFKCDNYLVSPSEVERVLSECPGVRDCAVVDYPDEFSGAYAAAFVVLQDGAAVDDLEAHLAMRVPYYQRVRHFEVVGAIPRTTNGKLSRRALRAELISRRTMAEKTAEDLDNLVTAVARFTTRDDPAAFEAFFLEHVEYMRARDGFGAHQAVRLADDPRVYLNFGWWTSKDTFLAVTTSEEFRSHQTVMRGLLEKAEVVLCKNVRRVNAGEAAGERAQFDVPLMQVCTFTTGDPLAFEAAFDRYAKVIADTYGFGYADLNRSFQEPGTYYGLAYWWDPAAFDKAAGTPEFAALAAAAAVRTETVVHVAWNRALGAEGDD
ncbi:AMP-binding protein [Actinocrispum wychmicini]|uniref:Long-chain acyl-CoA synthetase n=1 Tax=Actinocrispum wychmicini TaxID=1213861 RepID=A0A4R2JPG2_9PSEU|nr:AMP-binding protein [Actinocrispum wychmicini]TCO62051.1 long-chain acyl-CoA synthetase [Actinocrispum wychmicini]